MAIDRDLFGQPIPEKRRGRRRRAEEPAVKLPPVAPPVPGLGDLVVRLKPVHRRLEGDLAQSLARDGALQVEVERQCESLSRELGVALSQRQYVHTAATVYALKALFLRVAEDYGLFPAPARKIALRGDLYRELCGLAPRLSWDDYLEYAVRDLAYLPVAYDLFKETGYELIPPGDEAARALLDAVGHLPDLRAMDTRALGDLYEHLMDPEERKRLAYYPTPDFIIDFLLDRTLEPAIQEFGVYDLRYLDICCGTGHFGARAYRRIDRHLAAADPDLTPLERFERIMENNLFAVDVSEFATRITLFRLFLEGVRLAKSEGRDLAEWGGDITFNVYTANSLIKLSRQEAMPLFGDSQPPRRERDPVARYYGRELTHLRVDLDDALAKGFHVVNANPPYVRIQKQGADVVAPANGSWQVVDFVQYLRDSYETASGNFDLSVPFAERGLELLVAGGYLGYITSGKFAKQAYGKRIAALLAGQKYRLLFFADLTDAQVFEASAYPALIILQRPFGAALVPADARVEVLATYQPTSGTREEVWGKLRALLAHPGDAFEVHAGRYQERQGHFRAHPWTLRRGKLDLLARLKATCRKTLTDHVDSLGVDFITAADPVFRDYVTDSFIRRNRLEREICLPCLRGENIRNWTACWHGNRKREQTYVLYTLDLEKGEPIRLEMYSHAHRFLSRYRSYLEARALGWSGTVAEEGLPWWAINRRNAHLGVPKISYPDPALHSHVYFEDAASFVAQHTAQVAYLNHELDAPAQRVIAGIMSSSLMNYFVVRAAGRLQHGWLRFWASTLRNLPIPLLDGEGANELSECVIRLLEWARRVATLHPWVIVRDANYDSASDLTAALEKTRGLFGEMAEAAERLQGDIDRLVSSLYGLEGADFAELQQPANVRSWLRPDWQKDLVFEIRDYVCDMIEGVFGTQRLPQERQLSPAQIASTLASNPKFEPLRAVYYGGRPVSAEQFVRECLDWDCRPIPFDPEAVLVGRRPKRVDVLHERFFRFDGVDRDIYGWTGWSAEAQANVFLTLAERAADKTPFYRWVARLIDLPEESPDIEDAGLRAELRRLIGGAKPYPYVVME